MAIQVGAPGTNLQVLGQDPSTGTIIYAQQAPVPVQQQVMPAPAQVPVLGAGQGPINVLQTLAGGFNGVAGLMRARRLSELADKARDARELADKLQLEIKVTNAAASAAIQGGNDPTGLFMKLHELQYAVNQAQQECMTADARLERAQNEAEWYRVGNGAVQLATGLGYGGYAGGGVMQAASSVIPGMSGGGLTAPVVAGGLAGLGGAALYNALSPSSTVADRP